MTTAAFRGTGLAIAVAAALGVGYLFGGRDASAASDGGAAAVQQAPPGVAEAPATAALPDFSGIVQRYGPAVVNVSTTSAVKEDAAAFPFGQLDPDDPMSQFFRHFGMPQHPGRTITRGLGSGFIVSPDGLVLTNAHVVAGSSEVKVKLTDKREFKAKVVGLDKATDVAVLRIPAKDLPTVSVGDPSRTRVGEWVLAIGSPFGFENSATAGIVSARSRTLPESGYVQFLQTDVAVNPGNSGGPLFDTHGRVIGINSQIFSQSGGYMGLSFAIPIDVAMKVERDLVAHGKVTRGRLGVTVQDVSQALAESFGLKKAEGALVGSVEEGGPAARAGLQPGDVILSLNGKPIAGSPDLPPLVADLRPGTDAHLEVWRDHARRSVDVKVGESGDRTASNDTEGAHERGRLGLAVRPLTPDERKEAGVNEGLLVEGADGPAARAGIQRGDVVLALDGTRVGSVARLRELAGRSGDHVALLVQRGDSRIFVPLDLG
jgi:serine protease Do